LVDRAKALADYPALEGNAFWTYILEEFGKRMAEELKVLSSTDDLPGVYRVQGRVAVWDMLTRLPDDLVARLKR
jgi:hypothetical protein